MTKNLKIDRPLSDDELHHVNKWCEINETNFRDFFNDGIDALIDMAEESIRGEVIIDEE